MDEFDLVIETPDGAMPAFAVCPADGAAHPAVILYMDAPGIREELRDFSRRIAGQGYFCLLPDLYYRLGERDLYGMPAGDERRTAIVDAMNSLSNALVMRDTKGMLAALDKHPRVAAGKIGCIGYCMSGRYVVTAAATYPQSFAASASLYGVGIVTDQPDSPHLLADRIVGELYLGFAEVDRTVPDNVVPDLKAALDAHDVNYQLKVFPDTAHGFCFPEREVYREAAAEEVWEKVFELYARTLAPASASSR